MAKDLSSDLILHNYIITALHYRSTAGAGRAELRAFVMKKARVPMSGFNWFSWDGEHKV